MNNFEQHLISALMEMRKGPEDTTHVPAKWNYYLEKETKGSSGRSEEDQDKRNVFAGELKRHRAEVAGLKKHGTAEEEQFTRIAKAKDHERAGRTLAYLRRGSGQDEIPSFGLPRREEERFKEVPRGRTTKTSGERTNPTQVGAPDEPAHQGSAQGTGPRIRYRPGLLSRRAGASSEEKPKPKPKTKSVTESFKQYLARVLLENDDAYLSETYLGDAPPAKGVRRHSLRAVFARQGRGKFGSERSKKHSEERERIIADTQAARKKAAEAEAAGGFVGAVKKWFQKPKEETEENNL
jgi:hypothetical protein